MQRARILTAVQAVAIGIAAGCCRRATETQQSANVVPSGLVAVTLPVDRKTSPGRLLKPRAHVDLLARIPAEGAPHAGAVTLLEGVQVLAVGGRTQHDPQESVGVDVSTVTVEVTPEQAEKLIALTAYLHDGVTVVLRKPETAPVVTKDRLDEAMKRLGLARPQP